MEGMLSDYTMEGSSRIELRLLFSRVVLNVTFALDQFEFEHFDTVWLLVPPFDLL